MIFDLPPLIPFTDADVVGRQADGALIVIREDVTPKQVYLRAVNSITSTRVLGAVLNHASFTIADRGRYDYDYYERYYPPEERSGHGSADAETTEPENSP